MSCFINNMIRIIKNTEGYFVIVNTHKSELGYVCLKKSIYVWVGDTDKTNRHI